MNKAAFDPKVKKTFVRNCEQRLRIPSHRQVVREVDSSSRVVESGSSLQGTGLSEPTLCSSAALANCLAEIRNFSRPPLTSDDLNVDRGELCAKMTKKLNFHINDKIYRNLVELNANIEDLKTNKIKRQPKSAGVVRKDLEPNIEDFCQDEKEQDYPPKIPVLKPKSRPVKSVENGQLHKLVASFEIPL